MTNELDRVVIRRATPTDASELAAFAARCFEVAFGADTDQRDMQAYLAQAFSPAVQASEIAAIKSIVLLAWDGGLTDRLVAYAYFTALNDLIKLHRLYVDASWQGRGLAARLMGRIIDHCRVSRTKKIQLTVWTKNLKAIAFYKRVGFRIYGSETFMVGEDAQTDHAMELVVSS